MTGKTVHFVFFSPCGGTKEAVKALGRDLAAPVRDHDITLPQNRAARLAFGPEDVVILGFPVYAGRMPLNAQTLFAGLAGSDTPAALVAVYGNRAYEGALLDLHGLATAAGFRPVAAAAVIAEHSIAGAAQFSKNRPDVTDRDKLAAFGAGVLEKAESNPTTVDAPGAYPTWKTPAGFSFFPVVDAAACTACGRCAQVCPAGAIPAAAPKTTECADCIVCGACVKYCPAGARVLGDSKAREALASHRQGMITRKEPEFFL